MATFLRWFLSRRLVQGKKLLVRSALSLLLLLLCWPYFLLPHYAFPAPRPFNGAYWYNPYSSCDSAVQKCNFHLHSHAWGGLTDGHTDARRIDSIYRAMGYNVVNLSNYFSVDTLHQPADSSFIPAYEHGYSVQKSHRLVVGARSVFWLDAPLLQTRHIKQFFFSVLKPQCDLLVMAHPAFGRPSYTVEDAQCLSGYDCMEVLNHYRNSLAHWDSALSCGHLVWLIANDDSHRADNDHETGVRWTLACTGSASRDSIVSALRRGSSFGVAGYHGRCDLRLSDIAVEHDTLILRTHESFTRARVIRQHGHVVATSENDTILRYALQADDQYVRCEIDSGSTTLYTNPIVRSSQALSATASQNGKMPANLEVQCDLPLTLLWYFAFVLVIVPIIYIMMTTKTLLISAHTFESKT